MTLLVEGPTDQALVLRLFKHVGLPAGARHIAGSRARIRTRITGYNNAALFSPWCVLVDLDRDECAPGLVREWLPVPARYMSLRVAVRELEAWLLADREAISAFLGVPLGKVPKQPEGILDPKAEMIGLARTSRKRQIRADIVPRPASGRNVGPLYVSRLVEYISSHWRPEVAAENSGSLRRCLKRLREMRESL